VSDPNEVAVNGVRIEPGTRRRILIPIARLPTQTELSLPVEALNGVSGGPRLWLSATIHGDELNGLEIINRVLQRVDASELAGSLLAVPIVNVFGFIHQDRYLPDRRDLNRSFPGSKSGSLAAQTAHLFMREIVAQSTHGVDLHTGSHHRVNLPQVRGDLDDPETRRCALAFGAPMLIHGKAPPKSLRHSVVRRGIPILLYEAGQPQRFDEEAIAAGVDGILRLMTALGMRDGTDDPPAPAMVEARRRSWIRARRSGILRLDIELGDAVGKGQVLGTIEEVLGSASMPVTSRYDGIVIGHTSNPLVHRGDAIAHVARDPEPIGQDSGDR
jgi:predicted deacylase